MSLARKRSGGRLLILGLVVGTLAAGTPRARGDAIYSVIPLGAVTPVGLDNNGNAYVSQQSTASYTIDQSQYGLRPRVGYTTLQTARRYETSGPNAGTFTDLGANLPKGTNQTGSAVNPGSSNLVGVTPDGKALVTTSQGTFVTDGKTYTSATMPAQPPGYIPATPVGANPSGQVAFNSIDTTKDGDWQNIAAVAKGSTVTPITAPDGQHVQAAAINASGQVAGQMWDRSLGYWNTAKGQAFLTQNGQPVGLGTLGGDFSKPTAINGAGQVVGYSATGNMVTIPGYTPEYKQPETHAFLASNGTMKDLGTLANTLSSMATAINDKGQVVGYSSPSPIGSSYASTSPIGSAYWTWNPNNNRAFLYENGKMLDLNNLVVPTVNGFIIDRAIAINDNGQILATGIYNSSVENTLLLTPIDQPQPPAPEYMIPEPGTWVAFGVLLGGLALRGRRGVSRR